MLTLGVLSLSAVDDEVYLHQEADPRYRGAAIPSRAFRMLQNMTGEDDGSMRSLGMVWCVRVCVRVCVLVCAAACSAVRG